MSEYSVVVDVLRTRFERHALAVIVQHQAISGGENTARCTASGCEWSGPRSGSDGHASHVVSLLTADPTYLMPLKTMNRLVEHTMGFVDELGVEPKEDVLDTIVEKVRRLIAIAEDCECAAAQGTLIAADFKFSGEPSD